MKALKNLPFGKILDPLPLNESQAPLFIRYAYTMEKYCMELFPDIDKKIMTSKLNEAVEYHSQLIQIRMFKLETLFGDILQQEEIASQTEVEGATATLDRALEEKEQFEVAGDLKLLNAIKEVSILKAKIYSDLSKTLLNATPTFLQMLDEENMIITLYKRIENEMVLDAKVEHWYAKARNSISGFQ